MTGKSIELGLGLISIGRDWGFVEGQLPSEDEVNELLTTAVQLGIQFFDTAPAYGHSEERFGRFLRKLDSEIVDSLFISTKCGIHWDFEAWKDFDDHSYNALCRSIDQSLSRLPRIDLLQLHRASVETIQSEEVRKAFEYARVAGVRHFGVSIKDVAAAKRAVEDNLFDYLQFPFNSASPSMQDAFDLANAAGKQVLVNRPFGMGQLLYDHSGKPKTENVGIESYKFIVNQDFEGYILTGTKSPDHLRENIQMFQDAR